MSKACLSRRGSSPCSASLQMSTMGLLATASWTTVENAQMLEITGEISKQGDPVHSPVDTVDCVGCVDPAARYADNRERDSHGQSSNCWAGRHVGSARSGPRTSRRGRAGVCNHPPGPPASAAFRADLKSLRSLDFVQRNGKATFAPWSCHTRVESLIYLKSPGKIIGRGLPPAPGGKSSDFARPRARKPAWQATLRGRVEVSLQRSQLHAKRRWAAQAANSRRSTMSLIPRSARCGHELRRDRSARRD